MKSLITQLVENNKNRTTFTIEVPFDHVYQIIPDDNKIQIIFRRGLYRDIREKENNMKGGDIE